MADYFAPPGSVISTDRYPNRAQQVNFFKAYIQEEIALSGHHLTTTNPKYAEIKKRLKKLLSNAKALPAKLRKKPAAAERGDQTGVINAGDNADDNANDNGDDIPEYILDNLYKEVNKFVLASHIMWGLWGLIMAKAQAKEKTNDFDYVSYALQRFQEFRKLATEFKL